MLFFCGAHTLNFFYASLSSFFRLFPFKNVQPRKKKRKLDPNRIFTMRTYEYMWMCTNVYWRKIYIKCYKEIKSFFSFFHIWIYTYTHFTLHYTILYAFFYIYMCVIRNFKKIYLKFFFLHSLLFFGFDSTLNFTISITLIYHDCILNEKNRINPSLNNNVTHTF